MSKKRAKHNYTTEIELKSLLIRIKNKDKNKEVSIKNNNKINKYIKWYNKINSIKYHVDLMEKKKHIKKKLKNTIITMSENTIIDEESFDRFGKIILLMISKILSKPNFSGYTYRDDFYSDAIHKILKYMHNFDHTLISERTGQNVNSFAYISQIIHNSIVFIIKQKKKELDNIKNQVTMEIVSHQLNINDYNNIKETTYFSDEEYENSRENHELVFSKIETTLIDIVKDIDFSEFDKKDKITIYIPEDYKFSMEEYNDIKPYLKDNINIERIK